MVYHQQRAGHGAPESSCSIYTSCHRYRRSNESHLWAKKQRELFLCGLLTTEDHLLRLQIKTENSLDLKIASSSCLSEVSASTIRRGFKTSHWIVNKVEKRIIYLSHGIRIYNQKFLIVNKQPFFFLHIIANNHVGTINVVLLWKYWTNKQSHH